jgi:MFS family permease
MYTVGTIVSLRVTGPACHFKGRRLGACIGSIIVIASTVLSALATNTDQFVSGRFFLGFASVLCAAQAPSGLLRYLRLRIAAC